MSAPQLVVRINRLPATVWVLGSALLALLKLAGVIGWDWLWVLVPLWGAAALVALMLLVLLPAGWSR